MVEEEYDTVRSSNGVVLESYHMVPEFYRMVLEFYRAVEQSYHVVPEFYGVVFGFYHVVFGLEQRRYHGIGRLFAVIRPKRGLQGPGERGRGGGVSGVWRRACE